MAETADLIRGEAPQTAGNVGLPFQEESPLPPGYEGRRLSIAETIRARREKRLKDAAAHQKRNP
jgi:hypothetical protein